MIINSEIKKKKVVIINQVSRRRTRKSYSNVHITSSTKFLIGAFDRLKPDFSCPCDAEIVIPTDFIP